LVGLAVLGATRAQAAVVVRTIEHTVEVDGQSLFSIEFAVGTVAVEAARGDKIAIQAVLQCSRLNRRCRRQAESLRLDVDLRTAAIAVDVRGLSRNSLGGMPQIDLLIRVPTGIDVEVSLGVGEVAVSDLDTDVTVNLGVGDVRIRLDRDTAARVALEVGVGLVTIEPRRDVVRRSGFLFFGNEMRWNAGAGSAEVRVKIGVGQARVFLE
jgi:hypothetical protein